MTTFLLGIDVGGSKTEAAVAAAEDRILGKCVTPTDNSGGPGLLRSIERAVEGALAAAGANVDQVAAIAVGVPGQVDPARGIVSLAVNLNLTSYPLTRKLAQQIGNVPTLLENDVRLAAIGAYRALQEQDPLQSLAYLSIGTGVSAGIVRDGILYRGSQGMAGEIGHIVVEPDGHPCPCGLRGCLETIVSGPAIARQASPFLGHDGEGPATAQVYEAAQNGNRPAQQLVRRVSAYVARAVHWLAMTYDVERIVVGGGVTGAGAAFWAPVQEELGRLRAQSALAQKMLPEKRVAMLPQDFNPGVRGALALAGHAAGERPLTSTSP